VLSVPLPLLLSMPVTRRSSAEDIRVQRADRKGCQKKNISSAVFGDKEGGLHASTPPLSGFTSLSAPFLAIRLYILRSKETTRLSALASTTRALSCVYKVTAHQQP
jgi:hypothetical protein